MLSLRLRNRFMPKASRPLPSSMIVPGSGLATASEKVTLPAPKGPAAPVPVMLALVKLYVGDTDKISFHE